MQRITDFDLSWQWSNELKAEKARNIKSRVFNRILSQRECDYIDWLLGQVQKHKDDIINQRKVNSEDFESYKEWKLEQIKELKEEIEEVRLEGLTNSFN